MEKVEASPSKKVAPVHRGLCFDAAWNVGRFPSSSARVEPAAHLPAEGGEPRLLGPSGWTLEPPSAGEDSGIFFTALQIEDCLLKWTDVLARLRAH